MYIISITHYIIHIILSIFWRIMIRIEISDLETHSSLPFFNSCFFRFKLLIFRLYCALYIARKKNRKPSGLVTSEAIESSYLLLEFSLFCLRFVYMKYRLRHKRRIYQTFCPNQEYYHNQYSKEIISTVKAGENSERNSNNFVSVINTNFYKINVVCKNI